MKSKLVGEEDIQVAINASPSSCVVAGPQETIGKFSQALKEDGVQVRAVRSDIAFHSRMLLDLVDPLRDSLRGRVHAKTPSIPLYSTSAPDSRSPDLQDIEYWVNNMVQPVRLTQTIQIMAEDGYRTFVEVSSHPIISHSVHETLEEARISDAVVLSTMSREKPVMRQVLACIGRLYTLGVPLECMKPNRHGWNPEVPRTIWSPEAYWRNVAKVPLGRTSKHIPASNHLLGSRTIVWGTDHVLFETHVDEATRPYPGTHPLHGAETVPAAVLINTFLHAIDKSAFYLENMSLRVPVIVNPARQIQILVGGQSVTLTSRDVESSESGAWLVNTTTNIVPTTGVVTSATLSLADIRSRLTCELPKTFSIDYLANVGVPEMGFPWSVEEHLATGDEMLAKVYTNPDNMSGVNDLGTSIMDAATSIASTLFYKEPLLRMPTAIRRVISHGDVTGLKCGYVYCRTVQESSCEVDIFVCTEGGEVVFQFQGMAFAGLENVQNSRRGGTRELVHSLSWPPAVFNETPLNFRHVLFLSQISSKEKTEQYATQLNSHGYSTSWTAEARDLTDINGDTIVVHIPATTTTEVGVAEAASWSCKSLVSAANAISSNSKTSKAKLFSLINDGKDSNLVSAPLYGLARIMKSELPDVWGGLFETLEDGMFPLTSIKYIQGEDVVRHEDGIHRTARLRPFPSMKAGRHADHKRVSYSPGGTYLITGGLGALGLEVAKWMVERGARRLLLVSRRQLPHRSEWRGSREHRGVLDRISALEDLGATVHVLAIDISAPHAHVALRKAIDSLSMPTVTGIIHAAGVLENQSVEDITMEAFDRVLAPKMNGALCLDKLFPPGTLDFFILFSSCGQLLGFPGQASYASANACLDALAEQRRKKGDNATSILWTSWCGLGMAASTEYINAELEARGITDITTDEAFMAWDCITSLDTSQAVVLRALPIEDNEDPAHPILKDIVPRKPASISTASSASQAQETPRPTSGKELVAYLLEALSSAVAATLGIAKADIDPSVALAEMGMDSVMTVSFRTRVQKLLKVKMAPTLVWKCPTIHHLVRFFANEIEAGV